LDVESTVLGLPRLVDFESVAEPVVRFSSGDELGSAEGVTAKERGRGSERRVSAAD
jgi:hypothetical protein